jgi:hypothetical protein
MGERNQLMIAWAANNGVSVGDIGSNEGYKVFYSTYGDVIRFRNDFFVPLAGTRHPSNGDEIYNIGSSAYFWTSSPRERASRYFFVSPGQVDSNHHNSRDAGFSVRCFKNAILSAPSISSVSYSSQGTWTKGNVTVTVTLNQNGAALAGWSLNGTAFSKTFTENWA